MPYCPNCGEEVDEGAEFCGNCGASIEGESGKSKGGKSSLDIEENLEGALCYVLGWVTGIIFFILEKKSDFVRFNAMQSIITFLPLTVLYWILGWIARPRYYYHFRPGIPILVYLSWIVGLGTFLLALLLIYKAYQGKKYKLPVVGDIAENQV